MSLLDTLKGIVSDSVEGVVIDSRLLPDGGVALDLSGGGSEPGFSWGAVVKPTVRVQLKGSGSPIVVAPFGEPDDHVFYLLMFGGLLIVCLAGYGVYRGLAG